MDATRPDVKPGRGVGRREEKVNVLDPVGERGGRLLRTTDRTARAHVVFDKSSIGRAEDQDQDQE